MNVFTANQTKIIIIGRQYENDVTTIQFPIKKWREAFGNNGNFFLSVMRAKDSATYEVDIEVTDDYVLWTPTEADTQYKGYGEAQLTYRINGKVAKSEVFQIYTDRSLPNPVDPPAEWEGFVDRVENAAAKAESAVIHNPYINEENNHWMVWDFETEQYVDTGVPASGSSGASNWEDLTDKPFEEIGDNLKVVSGKLTVDTASEVQEDNTKPITSAAVFVEVGNIEVLLQHI